MRKVIITAVVLLAVIVGGLFFYQRYKPQILEVEDILPAKPLFYIHAYDARKQLDRLMSTGFWQSLDDLKPASFSAGKGDPQQDKFISEMKAQVFSDENRDMFNTFFGKEVALAFYPLSDTSVPSGMMSETDFLQFAESIAGNLVIVSRISPEAKLLEFFSGITGKMGGSVTVSEKKYRGEKIVSVIVTDVNVKFSYVKIGDFVVLGIGDQAAQNALDVLAKDKGSLKDDGSFEKAASGFLPVSDTKGFLNVEKVLSVIRDFVENFAPVTGLEASARIYDAFRKFSGLKVLGFSQHEDSVFKLKADLYFDKDEIDSSMASLYDKCVSTDNRSMDLIPQDVLAYYWSPCMDLGSYWAEMKKEIAKTKEYQQGGATFEDAERAFGLSMENDVIPALGNEFGGYLKDLKVTEKFPVPELAVFVKVRDKQKVQALIDKVLQQPMMIPQIEDYQGTPIQFFVIPAVDTIQPAYAFVDEYLFVASSREVIRGSVDSLQGRSGPLKENPGFKEIDQGLSGPATMTFFLDTALTIQKVKGVMAWTIETAQAEYDKTEAFKSGAERRLKEQKNAIAQLEDKIKLGQASLKDITKNIEDLQRSGLDTTQKQADLNGLKSQVSALESDLKIAQKEAAKLAGLIESYSKRLVRNDPSQQKQMLEGAVYPLLRGLETFRVMGARTQNKEEVIETLLLMKVDH